ncbi:hypothetical protein [Paenibacillus bouchesdurhonensis]|uniref:hypothetical protein n=1 Tax=Paenibacillus bouchesdurhonensis TaxID=1870990 RepID=UPI000DA61FF0|nr:hypothetical protein [Paenibacillus bouchesdurhonensis]
MSWLRVNIQTPEGSGELEMDGATAENGQSIIEGFMSVFGVKTQSESLTKSNNESSEKIEGLSKLAREIGATTTQTVADAARGLQCISPGEIVIPLPKIPQLPKSAVEITKPPLIGSGRNLTTPIAELVSKAVESGPKTIPEPEHYKTGIKYKDGVPHYRCRYWCKNPDCKNKGNHYIPEEERVVTCHVCGEELKVRMATDGKLQQDGWGNFFIADELVRFN